MKRLWLAIALLGIAAALCIASQFYLYHHMNDVLEQLDALEMYYHAADTENAMRIARKLAADYQKYSALMECFMSHNDLVDSQETAALLPSLLGQENREEFLMEMARLREQLHHLRDIDRPIWRNVL